ncbi:hypothetical protein TH61_04455 [Rufibacter sp. DG15C]|uniref:hypothetical protein n=1 Tax=Rufibacter sp. DG15C TaxID=1379909 RepID=UPI00078B27A4|nr:hypothetical protein [Rufibacter sp. DG15C]AMM50580.1 hypothetical protein TH61_04455 [Rufibacter sp. DG15C]
MKKTFLMMALAVGMTAFASSCDSKKENQIEENAENMEDAADDADNPAAEEAAEDMSDSADTVDPQ